MDKVTSKKAKQYSSLVEAYKSVFSSPAGELVLVDLMKNHGFNSSTFSGDVNKMLIKEGERNAILRILSILKMDMNAIYERIDRAAKDME